jgi:hypothetical protein
MKKWTLSAGALALLGLGENTSAFAALDNAAAEVLLRTTCTDNGATLNNCFTSVSTMETWIWSTRNPSSSNPLHVRIGPGAFTGNLACSGSTRGHTTYTGAGINNSIIVGSVSSMDCMNLTYESFSIHHSGLIAVATSGGLTVWKNIEVVGAQFGWWDSGTIPDCPKLRQKPPGKHYWFGSRIISTASNASADLSSALYWECEDEEAWVFGSEITSKSSRDWNTTYALLALAGKVNIYGSVIRNVPEPGKNVAETLGVVASAVAHTEVSIHGTGIDVIDPGANSAIALMAGGDATIRANESAFVLKSNGGTVTRAVEIGAVTGGIMAPYLWPNGTLPNLATPPSFIPKSGADMVVIPVSGVPHLLIYQRACGGGSSNWYDTHTKACY